MSFDLERNQNNKQIDDIIEATLKGTSDTEIIKVMRGIYYIIKEG